MARCKAAIAGQPCSNEVVDGHNLCVVHLDMERALRRTKDGKETTKLPIGCDTTEGVKASVDGCIQAIKRNLS